MGNKKVFVFLSVIILTQAIAASASRDIIQTENVTVTIDKQHEFVSPGSKSAFAINFELEEGWHFYASEKTAPGGMHLKSKPLSKDNYISFSDPVFRRSGRGQSGAVPAEMERQRDDRRARHPLREQQQQTRSSYRGRGEPHHGRCVASPFVRLRWRDDGCS